MDSGQFSVEFVVVYGVLLLLLSVVMFPLYNSSKTKAQRMSDLSQAREAASKLANAVNLVYTGSIGARQTVEYWLPKYVDNVRFSDNDQDNRIDVLVGFDTWDETVVVDTILPAENVGFDNEIEIDLDSRTLHRTTMTSDWDRWEVIKRRVVVSDDIIVRE